MHFDIGTNPNVANKQQGCIWQLLRMGQKAAKQPNYCILHWRLNALINDLFLHKFLLIFHALTSVFKKGEAGPRVKEQRKGIPTSLVISLTYFLIDRLLIKTKKPHIHL